jgi:hypothetical protein
MTRISYYPGKPHPSLLQRIYFTLPAKKDVLFVGVDALAYRHTGGSIDPMHFVILD